MAMLRAWGGTMAYVRISVFIVLFWSARVFGWGALGHETIATIALDHMSPTAKAHVQQLLSSNDDFTSGATWPDNIKRQAEWNHTSPYHFTNIETNSDYLSSLKENLEESTKGDVVQGLLKAETVLRDSRTPDTEKAFALKFLTHFVGDLHQPLHSGRPEDLGGNKISLRWNGKKMNLHALWDTYMVEDYYKDNFKGKQPLEKAAWYAEHLEQSNNAPQAQSIDVLAWIGQATEYQAVAYDATYNSNPSKYLKTALPVIEHQITLAGYRLAAYLNSIFAGEEMNPESISLIRAIQKVLPNFLKTISLMPDLNALELYSTPSAQELQPDRVWLFKEAATLSDFGDDCDD
jgi:hypothetical protein